ncbi:MAG: UvrABC system protein B [candidate division WS2 bacterium ADurb.Bin280]|uniref:UvrABC system protein B n=1 Tax=candidate division WS2 bacterium ADurb.Bin280 TaxID=1852829 RepID=A0A1V5SBL7_9BACT|nr:MAG: UvrABC system protein B [candidate division WS2 bacterium ADurb.Bin280]
MNKFKLSSKFNPAGSQVEAITNLARNIETGVKNQVLLGVTGSGKTFTVANVIEKVQKPTLVIAHNKTLAAQLTQEFREFFPNNAVEYFVSYYDYYQPEAYLKNSDTYIEKEATVNEEIDRLRNSATTSLMLRKDVVVIASVSCIYGLGSPEFYKQILQTIKTGDEIPRESIIRSLVDLQYVRNDVQISRGNFRVRGRNIEFMPADKEVIIRISYEDDRISSIDVLDVLSREVIERLNELTIFPAKHYVMPKSVIDEAVTKIERDLEKQLKIFRNENKIIEAERLSRRSRYDIEMIKEVGYCNGIENYSRYFENREAGSRPFTLIDYFKNNFGNDFLLVIDESHVTVPQIGAMYEGDKSRKDALVEYGFRLPSSRDNRPLKFKEFEQMMPQTIFMSATPAKYEKEVSEGRVVEQIVRPTGLVDPQIDVRPTKGQIADLESEITQRIARTERVLVTTLTKKMAEDLTAYLEEKNIKVRYLHSDVETLNRIRLLKDLRLGKFDVLVGVNLLREGLDLPEVTLVVVLDADKEGFLRSETSLIQTIGRAARNINGRVILYADHVTGSMQRAIDETARRRNVQIKYNIAHNITPKTIEKKITSMVEDEKTLPLDAVEKELSEEDLTFLIKQKENEMKVAAKELRFEEAAIIRDQVTSLKKSKKFFRKVR